MNRTLAACLAGLLMAGCADKESPPARQVNRSPPTAPQGTRPEVRTLITWLPADSETVIVQQVPSKTLSKRPETLDECFQQLASFNLLLAELKGGTDLHYDCAVSGARKFRPPSGFGMALYEGCTILRVHGKAQDDFVMALRAKTKPGFKVGALDVFVIETKVERTLYKGYFAVEDGLVFAASNDKFLREVLKLKALSEAGDASVAGPAMVEWNWIPADAPFLAVRHVNRDQMIRAFQFKPEDLARFPTGVAMSLDKARKTATITQSTSPPQSLEAAKVFWEATPLSRGTTLKPTIRQTDPSTTTITFDAAHRDSFDAYFIVMHVLGYTIFV